MCDCDAPQCFVSYVRKARVEHRCCECRGTIQRGEHYEYASGVWDEGPNNFKTCLQCVALREEIIQNLDRYDCAPCFGDVFEHAYESGLLPRPSQPVILCDCGKVLETPRDYATHCLEFPSHFTQSRAPK